MKYEKIGFFGLGLIGGSIARILKTLYPKASIIATSKHQETILEAYTAGVIDNGTLLPVSAFSDCDLIFLCAPVPDNVRTLEELSSIPRKDGALITDVGSVKGTIHKVAKDLGLSSCFIGGHPMAGSEKTGFANSSPALLENAYYLITPEPEVPSETVEAFTELVKALGCIPLVLDHKKHDLSTASISHLPHVIAAALVNLVKDADDEEETMKRIAAGGFKDITRIASSSPEMWESILLANRDSVLNLLGRYQESLSAIREKIASADGSAINGFFRSAKDYRDSLSIRKNPASILFELYVDLDDKEGQIALITAILAISRINLKNIGIVHNREYEQGVLHIEFYDPDSLARAAELLKEYHYTVYLR